MTKPIKVEALPFIVAIALALVGCTPPCEYECHDFSAGAGPKPVFRGKAQASWFENESSDLHIMLGIPIKSEVFGTISFRRGGSSLVYPLYSWDETNGMNCTFGCNGPPGFSFTGTNKMSFLRFIAEKAANGP